MNESRLGDVAQFVRGLTFKPTDVIEIGTPGSIAVMRTKNVQVELDTSDTWAIDRNLLEREEQVLLKGDLLVSSANSWNLVGKCCAIPELPWPSSFGGFVSVLRPSNGQVDPRYLYRWFSSTRVQATVRSFGQSTTNISNLNFNRCLDLAIPTPNMAEQRRIVEILDQADALRSLRKDTIALIDVLIQSAFNELVSPDQQTIMTSSVNDVGQVQSGLTVNSSRSRSPIRVPYLRVANVMRGRVTYRK